MSTTIPRTGGKPDSRRTAAWRGFRLGRPRIGGTDDADALSTLFDFPFEERRTLTYWSNVATVNTRAGTEIDSEQKRDAILQQMLAYFTEMWKVRQQQAPKFDLISMLAHGEATRDLPSRPQEFMGNLLLLIVGGNDTTRNSISGGLWALNKFPEEYAKLRANPDLVAKMVPEIIRYQSPVVHMRRTALCDTELNGKHIRKGDKVAMWYISGEPGTMREIEDADSFIIDDRKHRAGRGSICRLGSASIAASATGWRRCS